MTLWIGLVERYARAWVDAWWWSLVALPITLVVARMVSVRLDARGRPEPAHAGSLRSAGAAALRWLPTAALAAAAVVHAWSLRWLGDDAFISFRYAEQLVSGQGLVFNDGQFVEGYTNFLWTLLVAGGMALGVGPMFTSVALSLAAYAATVLLTGAVARRLGSTPWLPIAATMVAANYLAANYGTSGLETMFATALVTWGVERASANRPFVAGLSLVLATMSHPDHAIFYAALVAVVAVDGRAGRRQALWMLLPFVVLYLPYFLWRWQYYGSLLPNTYYAKSAYDAYFSQGGIYLVINVFAGGLFACIPLSLWAAWRHRSGLIARFYLLAAPLYLVYVAKVGGDFMLGRFLVPVLPLAFAFSEAGARELLTSNERRQRRVGYLAAIGLMLAALPLRILRPGEKAWHVADERTFYTTTHLDPTGILSSYADQARDLVRTLVSQGYSPVVATDCVGIVGYLSGLEIVDLLGLTTPKIAHRELRWRGRPGHEKVGGASYVWSEQVDLAIWPAFPPPYSQLTAAQIDERTYYLPRFKRPLFTALERCPDCGATDARSWLSSWRVPADDPEQLACDLWFANAYYFSENADPELRQALVSRVARSSPQYRSSALFLVDPLSPPAGWREARIFDFESLDGWVRGNDPPGTLERPQDWRANGETRGQDMIVGNVGALLNTMTYEEGDASTGSLRSPEFTVTGEVITFLLAGGVDSALGVELVVDGRSVYQARGCGSELMARRAWDVGNWRGKAAHLEIVDGASSPWGHIVVDSVSQWTRAR